MSSEMSPETPDPKGAPTTGATYTAQELNNLLIGVKNLILASPYSAEKAAALSLDALHQLQVTNPDLFHDPVLAANAAETFKVAAAAQSAIAQDVGTSVYAPGQSQGPALEPINPPKDDQGEDTDPKA